MAASYLPDWAQSSWRGPKVSFTLPPSYFFKFPPSHEPAALPPPPDNPALAHPFTIPSELYNAALSPNVPVTIALVYATAVTYLNSVNARRNNKPWAISKTRVFTIAVLLHNLTLALYSAWTCVGMINDLILVYERSSGPHGLAGTVDSLCKLHGPRGIGSAATHDSGTSQWSIANKAYHLSSTFLPETSDVGRIWNEGLAFYGWLFYLSKFYEVIDTLIIIAKGKKSSFLQTYHHAGAMMCMWAGIRYMSPPIWMFVMVNSFIHTVMYTFYFFTALRIKVPKPLKQVLTTMQITQFIFGASFAFLHYFIKYQIPVSTPYVYHVGKQIVQGASSLGADAASEFTSALAAATASADSNAWLKKFALRAAGREGLAQNVLNSRGDTFGMDAVHAVKDFVQREEVRYRDELKWVNCLDTSGQAFAIYLNIVYLLPLTWLFAQFFVNSYLRRSEAQRRRSLTDHVSLAGQSFSDAKKGVGRRLSEAFEDSQGWNGDGNGGPVVIDGEKVREELRKLDEKMRQSANDTAVATPGVEETRDMLKDGAAKAKSKASSAATTTKKAVQDFKQEVANSDGLDIEDVLKRAWATVESPKGKSSSTSHQSSSTTHQSSSVSSSHQVSSTTVFESSSVSRSTQDEVIGSSNLVRDADVDTQTGTKKKEGSHVIASNNSSTVDPSFLTNVSIADPLSHGKQQHQRSLLVTTDNPSPSLQSKPSELSSSSSDQDPFDEFSQTRPASSGSHASPIKSTTSSTSWQHTFPAAPPEPVNLSKQRSISPSKIPAPRKSDTNPNTQHTQSRKWHSRRRGHTEADTDSSQELIGASSPTSTGSRASDRRQSRKVFNQKRDEIEDVTKEKGDDDSALL